MNLMNHYGTDRVRYGSDVNRGLTAPPGGAGGIGGGGILDTRRLKVKRSALEDLAKAEATHEADTLDSGENRSAARNIFEMAKAAAGQRRPVGGGIFRGRDRLTPNMATGGLLGANQARRRSSNLALKMAQLRASPDYQDNDSTLSNLLGPKYKPAFAN